MVTAYRTESDSLGKKKVPSSAYYGIQTQRAIENFPISGVMHAPEFLDSFIIIKNIRADMPVINKVALQPKGIASKAKAGATILPRSPEKLTVPTAFDTPRSSYARDTILEPSGC